jgi:hypothetical protein
VDGLFDYVEARMRSEIEALPDGVYRATEIVESDGVTDDAVIYSLRRDAQAIIGALRVAKIGDQPQHSAAQKVLRPRAALAFDLDAGVQGLVVTFAIGYFQGN